MFRQLCQSLFAGVLLLPFLAAAGLSSAAEDFCGTVPLPKGKSLKVYETQSFIRGPLVSSKLVIRDEATWKKYVSENPELAKLKVDFATQMVLAYGEQPRGRGKSLSFVELLDTGKELRAVFHFRPTPPWLPILQDNIWPSHFVVVERSDKAVQFEVNDHPEWEGIHLFDLVQPDPAQPKVGQPVPAKIVPPLKLQPKLTFTIDGADLIVSTTITANNSPHALQTSYHVDGKYKVQLNYVLIQNSDLLVRSLKQVKVTWRLKGMAVIPGLTPAPAPLTYHVNETKVFLSTAELSGLMPQLADLKQAGEKFLKDVNKAK